MKRISSLCIALFVLSLPMWAWAEIPDQMRLQAYLTDDFGNPLSGNFDVALKLYTTQESDEAIWEDTQSITVDGGFLDLVVGGTENPLDANVFGEDGEAWLGIKIGEDPEMVPRQKITAVPYSTRASIAEYAKEAGNVPTDAEIIGMLEEDGTFALTAELSDGDPMTTPIQWSDLSGVPEAFSDGVDNQLSEAEVLQIVGDNNYVTSDQLDAYALRNQSCVSFGADYIVAGIGTDGNVICVQDRNTQYTAADFALSAQSCAEDYIMAGISEEGLPICVPDTDTTYDGSVFALSDQDCSAMGDNYYVAGFDGEGNVLCYADSDLLAGLSCEAGKIAKFDGESWDCADDNVLDESAVDAYVANNGYLTSVDWMEVTGIPTDFADGTDNVLDETAVDAFVANNGYLTSVDWMEVTGIPEDFSDGTDNVLDESAVDAYVANNGYALDTAVTGLEAALNDGSSSTSPVGWGDLVDVPVGLSDGDDNTQLSESEVDAFVANNGYLTSVDWTEVTGIPTDFADGVDADTLAGLACDYDQVAMWNGSSWACAYDYDSLGEIECGYGQLIAFNGEGWDCIDDADTKYGVAAGQGLVLTENAFALRPDCQSGEVLAWDPDALGTGIGGWVCRPGLPNDCSDGQIAQYVSDGFWVCVTDATLSESEVDAFVANNGYLTSVDWTEVTGIPTDFADGTDNVLDETAVDAYVANNGYLTSVDWMEVTGIPEDFSDGTDNVLDESAVDAYVANNGYALDTAVTGLEAALNDGSSSTSPVGWGDLVDVPVGLSDGDDNTQLSESEVDAFVANNGYLTSVDWMEVTGIPEDFSDGTDNVLDESAVDAYVANNGYALDTAVTGLEAALNDGSSSTSPVGWGDLVDVPVGLSDGDDNTQLSESEVDAFVANNGYLTSVDWMEVTGIPEDFADGVDADTLAGLACDYDQVAMWDGEGWSCAYDYDSLADIECGTGQLIAFNGEGWDCIDDADTKYGVAAGQGLVLTENAFALRPDCQSGEVLAWDPDALGTGIGGWVCRPGLPNDCSDGQIAQYTSDGFWVCVTDATLSESEVDAFVANNGYLTSVDWTEVTGIPEDFADGTDNVLDETAVDAFVANNGYLTSVDWMEVTGIPTDFADGTDDVLDESAVDAFVANNGYLTSVDWMEVTGIPEDFSDGTDDVLDESAVDAFVANNGYALDTAVTGLEAALNDGSSSTSPVGWGDLVDVPVGLSDGDDNTQLSESEVDAFVANNGYLTSVDWMEVTGIPEDFADGVDADTLAGLACDYDQVAMWDGEGWSCAYDYDSLADIECGTGQLIAFNGEGWDCIDDADTKYGVAAGQGLVLTENAFALRPDCQSGEVLAWDPDALGTGIGGWVCRPGLPNDCSDGQIAQYVSDGFWVCVTDATLSESEVDAFVANNGYLTSVDWTEVTGIPEDFADGTDNVLDETAVDAFVANNGYLTSVDWMEVTGIPTDFADGTDDVLDESAVDAFVANNGYLTSVDWMEVTGIPEDFSDGTDDVLDESAVDAFVANNGYALDTAVTGLEAALNDGSSSTSPVGWGDLVDVPVGLSDGDDNTQLSESEVDAFVANNGYLTSVDWMEVTGIPEDFADGVDADTLAGLACDYDQVAMWDGEGWSCAYDYDSLADIECGTGQLIAFNGEGWDCIDDADTKYGVAAGQGLVLTENAFALRPDCQSGEVLAWDPDALGTGIGGWVCRPGLPNDCSDGQIAQYVSDGFWVCVTDATLSESEVDAFVANNGYLTSVDWTEVTGIPTDFADGTDNVLDETAVDAYVANNGYLTSVDWMEVTGIPEDFSDGTDDVLDETAVDAFVANNGYALDTAVTGLEAALNDGSSSTSPVGWGDLVDVPVGLSDGDDNTQLSESEVDAFVANNGYLTSVDWTEVTGIPTDFSDGTDDVLDETAVDAYVANNGYLTSVDWTEVTGIPTDFADGTDDVLDESAVDAFVANNGYALDTAVTGLEAALNDGSSSTSPVGWGDLVDVPVGLSDGDDNTQLSESEVDAFVANNGYLTSVDWTEVTGIPEDFADGVDADTLAGLACDYDQVAMWDGEGWSCAYDYDSLGEIECGTGQLIAFNGEGWDCIDDADTKYGVAAGQGLVLTENAFALRPDCQSGEVLAWDPDALGTGIGGWVCRPGLPNDCSDGQIAQYTSDGFWVCVTDATLSESEVDAFVANNGYLTSVDWMEVTGIPEDFADGTDNVLDESAVDAFVANNGYALDTAVTGLEAALNDGSSSTSPVGWGDLVDVPVGLSDGDDNTQLSESEVDAFVANNGYLTSVDWTEVTGIPTDFADGTDNVLDESAVDAYVANNGYLTSVDWMEVTGIPEDFADGTDDVLDETAVDAFVANNGYLTSVDWTEVTGIPEDFADGVDADTLAGLACDYDQVAMWDGEGWSCAYDYDSLGEIECGTGQLIAFNGEGWDCIDDADTKYGVAAGQGLVLTENAFALRPDCQSGEVLAWDPDALGTGIGGWVCRPGLPNDCSDGQIAQYVSDGFWVCVTDATLSESEVDAYVANNGYLTSVDWTEVTGIPTDFSDGDDNTQLSESEVDAFVANNGYLTSVDWTEVTGIPTDFSDGTDDVLDETAVDAYVANNGYLTSVDWTEVTGIPTDFADGTDDVLDESAVDAFVANNGYALDTAVTGLEAALNDGSSSTSPVGWGDLVDVPVGLSDGDDNTQLSESEVDAFVANNGYLTSVDWTEVTGIPTDFADGVDADTLAGLACDYDQVAMWDGEGWSCAYDYDSLGEIECGTGQLIAFNGEGWDCIDDADTKYGVAAGQGLVLTENAFALRPDCQSGEVLAWDPDALGTGIGGWVCRPGLPNDCSDGQIAQYTSDGFWVCVTDATLSESEVDAFVANNGYLTSVDWMEVTGIPEDFADGTDNVLDESAVDAFVANNGYALDTAVTGLEAALNDGSSSTSPVGWGDLVDVPVGLSDGDDNTQLSESEVDAFVANNGYLTSVDWTEVTGIPTDFADGTDNVLDESAVDAYVANNGYLTSVDWMEVTGIPEDFADGTDDVLDETAVDAFVANNGYLTSVDWTEVTGIPEDFADGVDADTLAGLACDYDQVAMWDGEGWSCAYDYDSLGEIECGTGQLIAFNGEGWDCIDDADTKYGVAAGQGLVLTENAFALRPDCQSGEVLAWDPDALGTGIGGWVCRPGLPNDCSDGQIAQYVSDGFWVCVTDATLSESEVDAYVANNGYLTSVDWTEVTGIPTDFSDGDDNTQLSESEVDAFVANNGYLTSVDWTEVTGIPTDFSDGTDDVLDETAVDAYVANNGYLTSVDWTEVTGIPTDFADGTDDVLDESAVDAFVANNGYALDTAVTGLEAALNDGSSSTSPVGWGDLVDVPVGLSDGDDNTQLSESEVDAFVANNGYLTSVDWTEVTGIPTDFADGTDNVLDESAVDAYVANNGYLTSVDWMEVTGIPEDFADGTDDVLDETAVDAFVANNGYLTSVDWMEVTGIPEDFADGVDADTLAGLACDYDQVAMWDGEGWSCAYDYDSLADIECGTGQLIAFNGEGWDCIDDADTKYGVAAGQGLVLTENAFALRPDCQSGEVLAWDPDALGTGIGGWVCRPGLPNDCSDGQIAQYTSDGFWVCVTDATLSESEVDAFVANNGYLTSVDWMEVTGIPEDFADGTDNVLDETAVDAFVANNGYLTSVDWTEVTGIPEDFADGTDNVLDETAVDAYVANNGYLTSVDWMEVTGIPEDFSDGTDDVLDETAVDAFVANNGYLTSVDWMEVTGIPEDFADGTDNVLDETAVDAYVANNGYLTSVDWMEVTGIPEDFSDGVDADTLASVSCSVNQVVKYDGDGGWYCDNDNDTDTTYSGTDFALSDQTCSGAMYVSGFRTDGSVICTRPTQTSDASEITSGVFDSARLYTQTIIVRPDVDALSSGMALYNAVDGISGTSSDNRILVKIEPGVYDLGTDLYLYMDDPFVDLQGSGRGMTLIKGSGTSVAPISIAAEPVEVRDLTVISESSGGNNVALAIQGVSTKVSRVEAVIDLTGASFSDNVIMVSQTSVMGKTVALHDVNVKSNSNGYATSTTGIAFTNSGSFSGNTLAVSDSLLVINGSNVTSATGISVTGDIGAAEEDAPTLNLNSVTIDVNIPSSTVCTAFGLQTYAGRTVVDGADISIDLPTTSGFSATAISEQSSSPQVKNLVARLSAFNAVGVYRTDGLATVLPHTYDGLTIYAVGANTATGLNFNNDTQKSVTVLNSVLEVTAPAQSTGIAVTANTEAVNIGNTYITSYGATSMSVGVAVTGAAMDGIVRMDNSTIDSEAEVVTVAAGATFNGGSVKFNGMEPSIIGTYTCMYCYNVGEGGGAVVAPTEWSEIANKPAGFDDDTDDDTLGGLSCTMGQVAVWDSGWMCADQTTYTQGNGIDISTGIISVDAGLGLEFNTNSLELKLGEGLEFDGTNAVRPSIGDGLMVDASGIAVSPGDGLTFDTGNLTLDLGDGLIMTDGVVHTALGNGLAFNGMWIETALGDGLTWDIDYNITLDIGEGLDKSSGYLVTTLGDDIDSSEIQDGTITFADLADNSCATGDAMVYDGGAWSCSASNLHSHSASEITSGVLDTARMYVQTIVVRPGATETDSGDNLRDALASITDNGDTKPYLVKIEPGIYDLGNSLLGAKPYVDLQGSGRNATVVKGAAVDSGIINVTDGPVQIRDMTIMHNAAVSGDFYGILIADASVQIENVNVVLGSNVTTTEAYAIYVSHSAASDRIVDVHHVSIEWDDTGSPSLTSLAGIFHDVSTADGSVYNHRLRVSDTRISLPAQNADSIAGIGAGDATLLTESDEQSEIDLSDVTITIDAASSSLTGMLVGITSNNVKLFADNVRIDVLSGAHLGVFGVYSMESYLNLRGMNLFLDGVQASTSEAVGIGADSQLGTMFSAVSDSTITVQNYEFGAGVAAMDSATIWKNLTLVALSNTVMSIGFMGGNGESLSDSTVAVMSDAMAYAVSVQGSNTMVERCHLEALGVDEDSSRTVDVDSGSTFFGFSLLLVGGANSVHNLGTYSCMNCSDPEGNDISVTPKARILTVTGGDADLNNGKKLISALDSITDNSATNPYVIKVEPGIYDLDGTWLTMKNYVNIIGSGDTVTEIKTSVEGTNTSGAVLMATNSILKDLKVTNDVPGASQFVIGVNGACNLDLLESVTVKISSASSTATASLIGVYETCSGNANRTTFDKLNVNIANSGSALIATGVYAFTGTGTYNNILSVEDFTVNFEGSAIEVNGMFFNDSANTAVDDDEDLKVALKNGSITLTNNLAESDTNGLTVNGSFLDLDDVDIVTKTASSMSGQKGLNCNDMGTKIDSRHEINDLKITMMGTGSTVVGVTFFGNTDVGAVVNNLKLKIDASTMISQGMYVELMDTITVRNSEIMVAGDSGSNMGVFATNATVLMMGSMVASPEIALYSSVLQGAGLFRLVNTSISGVATEEQLSSMSCLNSNDLGSFNELPSNCAAMLVGLP